MIILYLIVFIVAVIAAIAAYRKDRTAILITSIIVAAVDMIVALFTVVPPAVELYPTDGRVSQEREVTLKTGWNCAIYYTLSSEEDPSVDGILYKEPIKIERTTVLNAKSKMGPKWGPLGTWIVYVNSSGEITGTQTDSSFNGEMVIDIEAEYMGDPLKVGDTLIQSDFQVKGLLADGTETIIDEFTIDPGDLSEPGSHGIKITYGGLETYCNIMVIDLERISVSYIGENLKVGDIVTKDMFDVYGTYTDGSKEKVTGFSILSDVYNEPGDYNVEIEYRGKQTTCHITVENNKPNQIQAGKEYTVSKVHFITYDDYISGDGDTNEYTYTAQYEGKYRFDVSDMMNGFKVNIAVYAPDKTIVAESSYGLMTEEGITAVLETGKTYTVRVSQYMDEGHYILTIGQQKETIDITNAEIVHDSIEYLDQRNQYDFTAKYGGKYRFDFENVYSGFKANIIVFDDHNYDIASTAYGLENNEGLSVELEAGKTYKVVVMQYRGTSTYDLLIGKQSDTQTINGETSVTGEITFNDQENRYDFVADMSGKYTFALSKMNSDVKCNVVVYDDYNYVVGGSAYGLGSGDKITATLEKGKQYRIVVCQYVNCGAYTLSISRDQE